MNNKPVTKGIHHVGLTVGSPEQSAAFFTELLGWREVRRDDDYPAIFVTDDTVMLTLWGARQPVREFDKNHHTGLHHLALAVDSEETLNNIFTRLEQADIKIEFSPEPLRDGPARHMMCYEPCGNRVEFIWPGN